MDLFQNEKNIRIYNISQKIDNTLKKFLGINNSLQELKNHLMAEVNELMSAKNKKEMAFECADVIILAMRILIRLGYKDPIEVVTQKGNIVMKRLRKAVEIFNETPGIDGEEAYRLAKHKIENE